MDKLNSKIRDFFIENFTRITDHADVKIAEERSERYSQMLSHYMETLGNCGCVKSADEAFVILKAASQSIERWIKSGGFHE